MTLPRPKQSNAPRRLVPPGVIPIELWDLELSSGILWDHMEADALPSALVEAVRRLRSGTALTRSRSPIPTLARELTSVWLAGGRAATFDPLPLATALGVPVCCAEDPTAVAERGARALVHDASPLAVIDLGQTRLKIFLGGERFEHERPWERLPILDTPTDPTVARTSLRTWVSKALTDATAHTGLRPDAVVLALPCALGDTPIPGSSSYPGMQGDARLVPDVMAAAGWTPRTVLVLNDAELAAVAAGLDPRRHGTLTLVLTLGFGVGGALRLP